MNNQAASAFAGSYKSLMFKQHMWEMYVEPKQILVYTKYTKN